MNNIHGLSNTEIAMFEEVSAIFDKYKANTRTFGMQLIHEHFPINANEVLHETNDKNNRSLTLQTLCIENIPENSIATAWAFDKTGKPQALIFCCDE